MKQLITSASSILPLKTLANGEVPDKNAISQACRIARRRVVMKGYKNDNLLADLGFTRLGTKQKIIYGYIDVGEKG
ncbi:MAG: hypothetical protein MJB14_00675 [Spirochaetes bacterium]|nr:hypothetical protein [Spirochaetota bacterium]